MTGLGGRYGDHRDWGEIDGWADSIADGLAAQPGSRSVTTRQRSA